MSDRVTPSQLARDLGVSRQAIYNLQERGVLPRDPDGKLDRSTATAAIAASVHPMGKAASAAGAKPSGDAPPPKMQLDLIQAKTLREITEAQIAKVKLDEMLKRLVPIADLESALQTAHIGCREWLRSETRPLAEACAGLPAEEIERILQQTFDIFLIRLATWQAGSDDEDDEDEDDESADE